MEIILAGYNVDYETIRTVGEALPELAEMTPETIAAAYARISRNPRPVNELRKLAGAEVDKARQSNRNIVFEMGHSSIAEHAVFNIDVLGVSRLLVEEIEKFRLCSYTEKSQRYVLFQDDFVIPEEIGRAGLKDSFVAMIHRQNSFYHRLYEKLRPYVFAVNTELAADPKNRSMLEGLAKEDARYIISLATQTQLGMTINARNLELMLRRLFAHPLAEARLYSRKLFDATKQIAPSLIRYTEATDYDRFTRRTLKEASAAISGAKVKSDSTSAAVVLYEVTPGADDKVLASLIHSSSRLPMAQCLEIVGDMNIDEKKGLMKHALCHLRAYDSVLREFEQVDLYFELVVSAGCFAQLKRHRMATLTCQDYDPALGVTAPPAIAAVGMEGEFRGIIAETEDIYKKLENACPEAAPYVLTNSHRRRVALKVNARELYHIARLRADRHAQWDIRDLTLEMLFLAKEAMPLTMMLAAGKDEFDRLRQDVFT